jgi:hypothetical protein
MVGGEGDVVQWMPILRQHYIVKFFRDAVDGRDDLFAAWHGKRASGAKSFCISITIKASLARSTLPADSCGRDCLSSSAFGPT